MNTIRSLAIALLLTLLQSCAQSGNQIGANVSLCCPGDYQSYEEYSLLVENVPYFLRSYVVAEFDTALQSKGLRRNDRSDDLQVQMKYNHVNLYPDQQEIDPFVRIESLNVEISYVAAIEVTMTDKQTNEIVWRGSISRIHHVQPGEYMHEDRARGEFTRAFARMLESYPVKI